MGNGRFYTTILLLGVMALNICKYQLPYIEYNLLRDYIAENLCVKRFEANNECRGKCHLNKQIDTVSKSDGSAGSTAEKKHLTLETDDFTAGSAAENRPSADGEASSTFLVCTCIAISLDIATPPPERFA
ncbi:MAG: hypothetical protein LBO71_03260 [Prevotellaceae bacterium]|jgi:hypothetical protein|nr:hypothetical protein [Prevotellaceae bacterium]